MRIVIDMQGAQNGSRHRGIGRYTLSLALALIRNRGEHELIFVLNAQFLETIDTLSDELRREDPSVQLAYWRGLEHVSFVDSSNDWRRKTSELIREAFLASLEPDLVLVTSMVEGASDDTVTSIGRFVDVPTAAIFYDLIPLIYPEEYLGVPRLSEWYQEKVLHLKEADILFAISESSRREAVRYLGVDGQKVFNVSAAIDPKFRKKDCTGLQASALGRRLPIKKPFILYTGATDSRKNLARLIQAFAQLPLSIRVEHQLVIAGGLPDMNRLALERVVITSGLKLDRDVIITGAVSDEELVYFYNSCRLYVFPSLHEGFGLPALEAMACGAVVIGSNVSSIPEVIGRDAALFDPGSIPEMAKKIIRALTDDVFRAELTNHALSQVKNFSWDITASRLVAAFSAGGFRRVQHDPEYLIESLIEKIALLCTMPYREHDLVHCAECIALVSKQKISWPQN